MDDPNKVKLVDFGSGSVVDGKQEKLTGTPLYMSPEQIALMHEFQQTGVLPSADFDPYMSDVYSLGMTFLHLALMEPPIKVLTHNRTAALTEYLGIVANPHPNVAYYIRCMVADNQAQRCSFDDIYTSLIHSFPQLRQDQSGYACQGQTATMGAPDSSYLPQQIGEAAQLATSQGLPGVEQYYGSTPSEPPYYPMQESCDGSMLAQSTDPNQQVYPPQINPGWVAQPLFTYYDDSIIERVPFCENPFMNTPLEGMEQRHIQEKEKWLFSYSTTESDVSEKLKFLDACKVVNCFEVQIFYRCQGCSIEIELSDSQQPICETHWLLCANCLNLHDSNCPNRLPGTLPE